MAGYIMTINNMDSLKQCVINGIYSTIIKETRFDTWNTAQEGTFADYLSMKEGDSIYFFCDRKIYGIGKLVNIAGDCKYLNYLNADLPYNYSKKEYRDNKPLLLKATVSNRCFCTFEPGPYWFMNGVDMDDALNSNPNKFRMLRAMWKVSFIKIDDEENQALQDIILKRNEEYIKCNSDVFKFSKRQHEAIVKKLDQNYKLKARSLLLSAKHDTKVRHEMAIEAALCELLSKNDDSIFGRWDYISHQVVASPFKAIDYMDKMDIFGYRYIEGFRTISKYIVVEIKKDDADEDVIDQIMKYVDWINSEYAHGDYSMIEAYIVASGFSEKVINKKQHDCIRNFTKGYRPTKTCTWTDCKLIQYTFDGNALDFSVVIDS